MIRAPRWLHATLTIALTAVLTFVAGVFLVTLLAGCNQTPTSLTGRDGKPSAIARKCPGGGYCDARNEECAPANAEYPRGYCIYVGDNQRAFGSKRAPSGLDGGQ